MTSNLIAQNQPQKEQELQFDSLSDSERRTLLAMMVGSSDKEAIALAPVKERRFYQLKPKLQEIMEQIKADLSGKAWEVLTGSVIKAAQILADGLNQPSYRYRLESAKNILDRVIGEPTKKIEARGQISILGIEIPKEVIENLTKPKAISTAGESSADFQTSTNPQDNLQATAV